MKTMKALAVPPPPPPDWTAGDGTGGKRKRAVNTRMFVSMTASGTFKDNPMRLQCQCLVRIGIVDRWCARYRVNGDFNQMSG